MTRSIAILIYPDAAGPISAFGNANYFAPGAYSISVVARKPGPVASDSNAALRAVRLSEDPLDTLIISGGDWRVRGSDQTLAWIKTATRQARHVASVCTGAFLLAEAGLLNGHRATTH